MPSSIFEQLRMLNEYPLDQVIPVLLVTFIARSCGNSVVGT
jgi:hypothetical protein